MTTLTALRGLEVPAATPAISLVVVPAAPLRGRREHAPFLTEVEA